MSRFLLILIALIVLIAGGLVFLSTQAKERPTAKVEQVVTLANLQ